MTGTSGAAAFRVGPVLARTRTCPDRAYESSVPLLFDHLGGEREQFWKNGEVFSYGT